MLRIVLVLAVVVTAAAVAIASTFTWANSKTSACVAEVDRLENAYRANMPGGRSHNAVENGISAARRHCEEGKVKEAQKATNTAGMICRLNNGCGKS